MCPGATHTKCGIYRYGRGMAEIEVTQDAAPWEGERVQQWLGKIADVDRQLVAVDGVLFPAASLSPGERVVDVGCGDGSVTRRIAAAVGATGSVVGLDISAEMLDHACQQRVEPGSAPIEWIAADVSKGAAAWSPAPPFDAVVSRFGVMFFDDPITAFASLAAATRSGGRLAVAVWRTRDESPLMGLPLEIATEVLDRRGCDYEPLANDQGPFSIHSASVAEALLADSGWVEPRFVAHDLSMLLSGGLGPAAASRSSLSFGPCGRRVKGQSSEVRAEVEARLTEEFQSHVDADGHVVLTGAVAVLTAVRS